LCADNQAEGKDRVWLDFSCEDNGMGMSREFLKRIFVPFERVNNEATSKIEGTGLGMSIVKNLIDRMGGEIQVESEEGAGSCFRVTLPADVSRRDRKSPNLTAGATVLIAEALEHRSGKICGFLRECGLVPVVVTSGLTAVTWLTEAQYENRMPCAMLLGQKLEDTPSLELASHIRQLAGASFPILLVSETDWSQIEYRATRAGINAFVPCPLFKSRLLETMSRLLNAGQEDSDKGIDGDYGGCHVLLVEDNELNQEIALELLSLIGVNVKTADNGQEALELFEASDENYFDVIFMDIQMPVMNGYEAARRIRRLNRPDAGEVFIVAMTANAFVEDIRLSREAGMNDHISKPIDFEHLKEILSRQLKIRKS
ncbi:MAG: response regulator, partial [Lachnospiraceae bacterium]|nr:response regulator [Lachnospiraceae bacterium]